MHAGNGDIGPHNAVASKHNTWIHDAVAPRCDTFAQNSAKLSKPTWDSLLAMAEMHFASVVAKIAEFGAGTEVCAFTEDGIADVIEVGRFSTREKNGMFGLGCMTDHSISTDP